MSNTTTYQQFVNAIIKPGDEIICQLTPQQANLLHMAVGVSGEAGELLDAIKKHCVYQKQIDLNNVMEEAGDILFYLTGLLSELDMTIEECIEANMNKLVSSGYKIPFHTLEEGVKDYVENYLTEHKYY